MCRLGALILVLLHEGKLPFYVILSSRQVQMIKPVSLSVQMYLDSEWKSGKLMMIVILSEHL